VVLLVVVVVVVVEEEEEEEDMEVAPSLVKFLYRLATYYIRSAAVAASPVG
jgi:hypothetical protein